MDGEADRDGGGGDGLAWAKAGAKTPRGCRREPVPGTGGCGPRGDRGRRQNAASPSSTSIAFRPGAGETSPTASRSPRWNHRRAGALAPTPPAASRPPAACAFPSPAPPPRTGTLWTPPPSPYGPEKDSIDPMGESRPNPGPNKSWPKNTSKRIEQRGRGGRGRPNLGRPARGWGSPGRVFNPGSSGTLRGAPSAPREGGGERKN